MGTYSIAETVAHPTKFACQVSFNGQAAHYHEVESLDKVEIDASLQSTADDHEKMLADIAAVEVAKGAIVVGVDGKIKL
jgi:glutamine amidotransferase-like uncharacterized protein